MLMGQFNIPDKPTLQTSVYDYKNLLQPGEKNALEEKLVRYSDSTSTQIVVVIIGSTEGENINYLGAQWGQKWGIGQAKEDNGILILLALDDKRIAINTGYGIEHLLTDALSKRVIENVILPEFRQGDFYGGLDRGVDVIFEILSGAYKGSPKPSGPEKVPIGPMLLLLFIFFIFLIAISRNKGNRGGGSRGKSPGLDLMDIIILSNMGRGGYRGGGGGGFGGGGFGGGGFGGGFGGGGFGGGGASGGW